MHKKMCYGSVPRWLIYDMVQNIIMIWGSTVLLKGTAEMVSLEKHPDDWPATLLQYPAIRKKMINTTFSTRVKAPATRDPDPLHVSNETYDG